MTRTRLESWGSSQRPCPSPVQRLTAHGLLGDIHGAPVRVIIGEAAAKPPRALSLHLPLSRGVASGRSRRPRCPTKAQRQRLPAPHPEKCRPSRAGRGPPGSPESSRHRRWAARFAVGRRRRKQTSGTPPVPAGNAPSTSRGQSGSAKASGAKLSVLCASVLMSLRKLRDRDSMAGGPAPANGSTGRNNKDERNDKEGTKQKQKKRKAKANAQYCTDTSTMWPHDAAANSNPPCLAKTVP